MTTTYDRGNLPPAEMFHEWMRRPTRVRMARLAGPCTVVTAGGADVDLPADWVGFLAVDSGGDPYPIAADEHARIYDRADAARLWPLPLGVDVDIVLAAAGASAQRCRIVAVLNFDGEPEAEAPPYALEVDIVNPADGSVNGHALVPWHAVAVVTFPAEAAG